MDLSDIYLIAEQRRAEHGVVISRMREVALHYHDDVTLPMPELDEREKFAIPNLLAQGIDQFGQRIASVLPDMDWPALDPTKQTSIKKSQLARRTAFGWWEASAMDLLLRQRGRWLVAYGTTPVVISPDFKARVPSWDPRNPMLTLPGPKLRPYDVGVPDCAFIYTRSHKWLRDTYGIQFPVRFKDGRTGILADEALIECVEWRDADEYVLMAVGTGTNSTWRDAYSGLGKEIVAVGSTPGGYSGKTLIGLERVVNRVGVCTVSFPGRIGLERIAGQMDTILGMREMQARLMALEINAVERAIFPNEWVTFDQSGQGQVVVMADGRKGIVGEIRGGTVNVTNIQPGVQTYQATNYLERAQRLSAGIPADFGGESQTNVRTGRRGEQLLSATVDFPLQESHQILAHSLRYENQLAVAVAKAYFGKERVTVHVSWAGLKAKGEATYVAADLFESDRNTVTYAQAGADQNSLVVGIGQRVGSRMLSTATGRSLDPLIDNPEEEGRLVQLEGIELAVEEGLKQQAAAGALPLDDLVFIGEQLMKPGARLIEAVREAQERAKERQASSGEPGTPAGPVEPGTPEAQPGLAAGTPAEIGATAPVISEIPQAQVNYAAALRALQTTSRAANAGGG